MASNCSRPSACSAESVEGDIAEQQRRRAWAWAQREEKIKGTRERMGGNVVVEEVERDGGDSLWRVLCMLVGRPDSEEEVLRRGVVARVEEGQISGTLAEYLLPHEAGWKRYLLRVAQGRRMGGPPEVEAWAVGRGFCVTVYRETRNGEGYRKLVDYGEGDPLGAGILGNKKRVYTVLWGVRAEEHEEESMAAAVQRVLDMAQDEQQSSPYLPRTDFAQVFLPGRHFRLLYDSPRPAGFWWLCHVTFCECSANLVCR